MPGGLCERKAGIALGFDGRGRDACDLLAIATESRDWIQQRDAVSNRHCFLRNDCHFVVVSGTPGYSEGGPSYRKCVGDLLHDIFPPDKFSKAANLVTTFNELAAKYRILSADDESLSEERHWDEYQRLSLTKIDQTGFKQRQSLLDQALEQAKSVRERKLGGMDVEHCHRHRYNLGLVPLQLNHVRFCSTLWFNQEPRSGGWRVCLDLPPPRRSKPPAHSDRWGPPLCGLRKASTHTPSQSLWKLYASAVVNAPLISGVCDEGALASKNDPR